MGKVPRGDEDDNKPMADAFFVRELIPLAFSSEW